MVLKGLVRKQKNRKKIIGELCRSVICFLKRITNVIIGFSIYNPFQKKISKTLVIFFFVVELG
jgi:hypothetical protein